MVELNHEQIRKDPHIITKIRPFLGHYERKNINFSSHAKD